MLANGTQIAISATETKSIEDLRVGDTIWAAGLGRDWKTATIQFSSGTGPDSAFQAVQCIVEDGRELICVRRQKLLTTRGLLSTENILPGDKLIQADGQTVQIVALALGTSTRGEHAVATSTRPTSDPEGHLIVAQGVIIADYMFNIGSWSAHQEAPVA